MGAYSNPAEQMLGRLRSELDYANIHEVIKNGLHEYLDSFEAKLNLSGNALFATLMAIKPIPGFSVIKRNEQ